MFAETVSEFQLDAFLTPPGRESTALPTERRLFPVELLQDKFPCMLHSAKFTAVLLSRRGRGGGITVASVESVSFRVIGHIHTWWPLARMQAVHILCVYCCRLTLSVRGWSH